MCRPENLRRSVETINKALGGLKKMDLFEPARIAGNATIEEMITTLAALKAEGHFAHIGLSECSAASLRKAHAVRVYNLRIQFAQILTYAPVNRSTPSRLSRLKLICGRTRKRPKRVGARLRRSCNVSMFDVPCYSHRNGEGTRRHRGGVLASRSGLFDGNDQEPC